MRKFAAVALAIVMVFAVYGAVNACSGASKASQASAGSCGTVKAQTADAAKSCAGNDLKAQVMTADVKNDAGKTAEVNQACQNSCKPGQMKGTAACPYMDDKAAAKGAKATQPSPTRLEKSKTVQKDKSSSTLAATGESSK